MAERTGALVLVVDDEPDAVEFVRAVLEEAGHRVISGSNGEEGLQKAREEGPDLIILDVEMPGKDGFTVFAEMRGEAQFKETPIVMLTGVRQKVGIPFSAEDMGEYFGEEPAAYVEKPVDPDKLVQTVQEVLAGS
jgi:twitching motility two-component system response regulator PilH